MSKEREEKQKSGMKAPEKNLRDKRAAKEIKREDKRAGSKIVIFFKPEDLGLN